MKRVGRTPAYVCMAAFAVSLFLCHPAYGEVEVYDMETQAPESTPQEESGITEESLPLPLEAGTPSSSLTAEEDKPEVTVEEVRIRERLHSDTGIYEGAIQDRYLFQTNVSNGGVTDSPVYFNIPGEITAVVSREGTAVPYASGDQLKEPGSYVVNFSVVDQVSENSRKEYRSVFQFKIREKQEPDKNGAEAESAEAGLAGGGLTGGLAGAGLTGGLAGGLAESGAQEPELAEPDTKVSGISAAGEEAEGIELPAMTGYDTTAPQTFLHRFTSGLSVSSNIPNGTITSGEVNLKIDGDAPFSVYKDEEALEWKNGMILQAAGNYTVISGKETFSFRISRYFTKSRWFYAPEGFQIKHVNFKNNTVKIYDTDRFLLNQDGVYEVELINHSGAVLKSLFEKDSQQPVFTVNTSKNSAAVEFQSTDIEEVHVYKDGKEIRPPYGNIYTEAGGYRILCVDHAGNFEEKEFEVPFKMNTFSVLLIPLTLGILLVLIGTVFVTKNKFKIR